jgi:hypothetical protein
VTAHEAIDNGMSFPGVFGEGHIRFFANVVVGERTKINVVIKIFLLQKFIIFLLAN